MANISKSSKGKNKEKRLQKNKKTFIFLTVLLMVVAAGSVVVINLLPLSRETLSDQKELEAPAYYFSKEDEVSSATKVLGSRDFKTPAEEQSKDGQESEKKLYTYVHVEDVSADLTAYKTYLEEEKNFIDVTKNNQEEESSSPEEYAMIYELAGPSSDSDSYLSITLEAEAESYTVTACKESQPWNTYIKTMWGQQKKELADTSSSPQTNSTLEQAEKSVSALGREKLGLPEPTDSYEYIAAPGIAKIDGSNYYTVRTYKRQANSTLVYIATYLSDYSSGNVAFQYDEVTGEVTPLP